MHRYRDAIYYSLSADQQLKREIIGGYVLYPGNLNKDKFIDSYYHSSIKSVNIGAFPLKPGGNWNEVSDEILLDPNSSEDVLYQQIKVWLTEDRSQVELLRNSLPQKGLNYSIEEVKDALYFIAAIDRSVNDNPDELRNGTATAYFSGFMGPQSSQDLQAIRYFAPKFGHDIFGYYVVKSVKLVDLGNQDKPTRIMFELGEYRPFKNVKPFGRDREAMRGISLNRDDFYQFFQKEETEAE